MWDDIQDYKYVLRAFLEEMQEMEVGDYPDAFIDASLNFLNNTSLLTTFVNVVFLKTK